MSVSIVRLIYMNMYDAFNLFPQGSLTLKDFWGETSGRLPESFRELPGQQQ